MKVAVGIALALELLLPLFGALTGGLAFDADPWDQRHLRWGLLMMAAAAACEGMRQVAASRVPRDSSLHAPLRAKRLALASMACAVLVAVAYVYPLAGAPLVALLLVIVVVSLVVR